MADFGDWSCDHSRQEKVLTYGGTAIALRCKSCTAIICPIGNCVGCTKKAVPLRCAVSRRGYCTRDCYLADMAKKRCAEKEAQRELVKP